ncbi:hypothetical protein [Helicobacter acinonychis]|uniref:Uncharacterized protein n=1 Tax=Helicobacter acinonychis (strain Sheeba) TaxID=382638 RepID=Q17W95_HELAH|nr:hypothetical protein [Helicobacter acinonychis]CAK00081.1 hypothetical protein Hac_1343 [Helicobacter acinonychis str. Sheeba]
MDYRILTINNNPKGGQILSTEHPIQFKHSNIDDLYVGNTSQYNESNTFRELAKTGHYFWIDASRSNNPQQQNRIKDCAFWQNIETVLNALSKTGTEIFKTTLKQYKHQIKEMSAQRNYANPRYIHMPHTCTALDTLPMVTKEIFNVRGKQVIRSRFKAT